MPSDKAIVWLSKLSGCECDTLDFRFREATGVNVNPGCDYCGNDWEAWLTIEMLRALAKWGGDAVELHVGVSGGGCSVYCASIGINDRKDEFLSALAAVEAAAEMED